MHSYAEDPRPGPSSRPSCLGTYTLLCFLLIGAAALFVVGTFIGIAYAGPSVLVGDVYTLIPEPDGTTRPALPLTPVVVPPTIVSDPVSAQKRFRLQVGVPLQLWNRGGIALTFRPGTLTPYVAPMASVLDCFGALSALPAVLPGTPLVKSAPADAFITSCLGGRAPAPKAMVTDTFDLRTEDRRSKHPLSIGPSTGRAPQPQYRSTVCNDSSVGRWILSSPETKIEMDAVRVSALSTASRTIALSVDTPIGGEGTRFVSQMETDCQKLKALHCGIIFRGYSSTMLGVWSIRSAETVSMEVQFRIPCDQLASRTTD